MEKSDIEERSFLDLQNRFRGLIANLRSKRFVEKPSIDPIRIFRSGLNSLYLDMRAILTVGQYGPMIAWVSEQLKGQLYEIVHAPLSYDELSGVRANAPRVSLDREIFWISHRIRMNAAQLNAVSKATQFLSVATFNGAYEEALSTLSLIQEALGVSLWSVQLRIGLEQQAGGLERQKRYSAEVRKVYKRGLLNFMAYHTSVRNEDRTTLPKFLDDVETRIDNHAHYDDALKTYARYRLKGELPPTDTGLADIMRVEQSHTIVDVYQTFVAVLQEVVARGVSSERREVIAAALEAFPVEDFRIEKILQLVTDSSSHPDALVRSSTLSDLLFTGKVKQAALVAQRRRRTLSDPWDYIYGAIAQAHRRDNTTPLATVKPDNAVHALASILGRTEDAAEIAPQLSKLMLNFRGLPIGAGIAEFESIWRRTRPDAVWEPFRIGLNSPSFGIEDIPVPCPTGCSEDGEHENLQSPTGRFWHVVDGCGTLPAAPSDVGKLAIALRGIVAGELEDAIEATHDVQTWQQPVRAIGIEARLHALYSRGDRTGLIELIAREGAKGPQMSHFMPLVKSLQGLAWPDYREVANPLAPPIALHLLWDQVDDSNVASLLRFATSQALRVPHKRKPSTFTPNPQIYTHDELVYFLRHVCVPNILDQSRVVAGTRGILEERQAICSLLIELDPENTAQYNEEITDIAEQLAIDEGQWIVDSTRIYVDTGALLRWAQRELQEDFGRYRDLLGIEIGHAQSFEDVLRELLETNPANRSAYTPESEAEAVLVSMLRRLGQEFLSNPIFGLDFNLSKRVRHQSFVGLIRGPIEISQLITTRESEAGEYHRNDYWVDKFAKGGDQIDEALRTFAAKFDDTITSAKDNLLHLKSADQPEGLIVLNLSARLVQIARSIISLDISFDEFVSSAMTILWTGLDSSLRAVRELISVELKARLIDAFDELRASVRKVAEGDPAFFDFDAAVGNGSAEVQIRLDEAANWFQHADRIRHETAFTLEQVVKIAADTALKSQRNYTPQLTYKVDGELVMYAYNLIVVHDVLFVALGNAQKHSGLKSPKIDVHVQYNEVNSTLLIEATCDSRASNRAANEKHLEVIRALIDSGSIAPRTRKEGGSGFVKLAALVGQSKSGRIDFGYTAEGRFKLSVIYGVTMLSEGTQHVN